MFRGHVAALHRWPVKSLRGEEVTAARVAGGGMVGDRAHVLVDRGGKRAGSVLTVRQNPGMLRWAASYGDVADPVDAPALRDPDGAEWKWDDPRLPAALGESLDIPLDLRSEHGNQDRGPTVLLTLRSTLEALTAELGAEVDLLRFRPNAHLDLDAPPFAELDWGPGTTITAGEVTFEITGPRTGPCVRCAVPSWDAGGQRRWKELQTHLIERHDNRFGAIARVTRDGTARRGDRAAVVRPAS